MAVFKAVIGVSLLLAGVLPLTSSAARAASPAAGKVLIVVSSLDRKTEDQVGGFWFPELTHPVAVFDRAGVSYDVASPRGGLAPFDGFDLKDPASLAFWTSAGHRNKLGNTLRLSDVDPSAYAAVLLVGGHGPMWDFVRNPELEAIVRDIYESGGLVAAVCHGPAGLIDVRLRDGTRLVQGRRLTAFTAEEEAARGYDRIVPFELESALVAAGARFSEAPVFESRVVVDGRIITGQNPASATPLGEAIVAALGARAGTGR